MVAVVEVRKSFRVKVNIPNNDHYLILDVFAESLEDAVKKIQSYYDRDHEDEGFRAEAAPTH